VRVNNAVEIERLGPALVLWLNRPDRHNALDADTCDQLADALESVRAKEARVVFLRGRGKSFCSGADRDWIATVSRQDARARGRCADTILRALNAIRTCPLPVVALAHGAVIGGGVGLVAACDIAVATRTCRFQLPEVRVGLVPACIAPFLLEKIGPGRTSWLALTATQINATQARELGLIHEMLPAPAALDKRQLTLTTHFAQSSPTALARTKQLLARSIPSASLVRKVFIQQTGTDDCRQRIRPVPHKTPF
jgi:methylglutaconyl-CoA hydratase